MHVFIAIFVLSVAQPGPAGKDSVRVGTIKISGNTITRDSVILEASDLLIGMRLDPGDLREATERINRTGIVTATIEIQNQEDVFWDILIHVRELNTLNVEVESITTNGRKVWRLSIEERNFDPDYRLRSVSDLWIGRILRGGGQRAAITLAVPRIPSIDGWKTLATLVWKKHRFVE